MNEQDNNKQGKETQKKISIFSPEHPFAEFMKKLGWTVILNLFWALCSLPIITMGASTVALYTVMLDMTEEKYDNWIMLFFRAFKRNFKQATIYWIIVVLIAFICYVDIAYFILYMGGTMGIICAVIAGIITVALACMIVTLFPVMAKFQGSMKTIFYITRYISVHHFKAAIVSVIITGVILFCMYNIVFFYYMVIFGYGLVAFILSYIYNKIFRQYIDENDNVTIP